MPTFKKSKQTPFHIFELMTAAIVLVMVGILTTASLIRVSVSCQRLVQETKGLIDKKKYKQAYDRLLPYRETCGESSTKREDLKNKITRLEFHHNLAVAAYVVKDKSIAESEADKGLLINQKLNTSQRQSVPTELTFDMAYVKTGQY